LYVSSALVWVHGTHPILNRSIHITKDIVPDVSILLLALAGLGYLTPSTVKSIEENKVLRRILAAIFLLIAVLTIVLNEVDRIEKEGQSQQFSSTLTTLASQNGEILKDVVANKDVPEVERRKHILALLRNEYVLAHPAVPARLLSGDEPLPADWTNQRLRELGESWTVAEEAKTPPITPMQRSYIVFDGTPIFTGSTSQTEGGDFKPGDPLGFNVYFKVTGPNATQMVNTALEAFIEPDYSPNTQSKVASKFISRVKREIKALEPSPNATMNPGDRHFATAFAFASPDSKEHRVLTQQDLDDLHAGRSVAFVVMQITYKDGGKTHHLRQLVFLQPPAAPTGVWHFGQPFNNSD
jgi:hypothetical protein